MILDAMIQDSHVTAKALSERLGLSTTTIDNHIAKLKEYGNPYQERLQKKWSMGGSLKRKR